ncbi:hypothetical protein EV189_1217 [Motilibacter rhizosphaerae]|uniref:GH15 family glucan-1,4-alpha-glucosidase n=1 Tax=Motilibacter rhizosphaerae TaxID=598652 RepID=A0A4Q7NRC6_9ACTN|nr:hypothetical protein EV189_1217 [Motilibacter rhizosphaerae]
MGALAAAALALTTAYAAEPRGMAAPVHLRSSGVAGSPGSVVVLGEDVPDGAQWVPGSSVLRTPAGGLVGGTIADVDAARAWLASGVVPGATPADRSTAERALLDLRLLTRPDGALLAGPEGAWAYVWPRDASFAAAAYAATGHVDDAARVLGFVAAQQRPDGTWAARVRPDGDVPDGRPDQLDATGWFPWAVWSAVASARRDGDTAAADDLERHLLPAVRRAVAAAEAQVDSRGVPAASQDYWEDRVLGPTLGTAAALSAGMHAAAALGVAPAAGLARRLDRRLALDWPGTSRYQHGEGGSDAAVAWLGAPFRPAPSSLASRLRVAQRRLTAPAGGLRPGSRFTAAHVSWTPETAAFALAWAASGSRDRAEGWLRWLEGVRTPLGSLPEKVSATGEPASVAPLAWTDAEVLLALVALDRGLPTPP